MMASPQQVNFATPRQTYAVSQLANNQVSNMNINSLPYAGKRRATVDYNIINTQESSAKKNLDRLNAP